MNAIKVSEFGGPEVLQFSQGVKQPEVGDGQVLVKVESVGLNPVETYMRSGNYPRLPALPFTPGMEGAGTVAVVGKNVDGVSVGDRVWFHGNKSGADAQFCTCDQDQIHSLPVNITFDQGAALWIAYATAYHALFQICSLPSRPFGDSEREKVVLIHGASGGVGLACVQLAKATPNTIVIGTASTSEGRDKVTQAGAHHVFDHRKDGYLDEIVAGTGGRGPDLIVEMLGNINLSNDLRIIALGGEVGIVGNRGELMFNPRSIMGKRAAVKGVQLALSTDEEKKEILAAISKGIQEGGAIFPIIRKTYKLEDISQAHKDIMDNSFYSGGKLVLKPWE
eukprot:TRINITY_DN1616_c0_g1_i1.p1 TRINITY_DN1616_c0_g1~~TRINITY_DN1616_c0_g1_i1.p1  ORF type:complete len:336 (-),score=89.30 TRINITY_DN1616_c0_g1_i1:108-1115(-)